MPKSVAKKIRRLRRVPMKENLKAWLLPWRNAKGYIYPQVCAPAPETIRLAAVTGLPWIKNGLRHTATTHRMAEVGNAGQVAEELGTSVSRIKANYDAVPADIDPEAYYGIRPDAGSARKILGLDGKPT